MATRIRLMVHAHKRLPTILLIWGFLWGIAVLRVLDNMGDSAPHSAIPNLASEAEVGEEVEEIVYQKAPRIWCCRSIQVFGCTRPNHVQVPVWTDPDFHPRLDSADAHRLGNRECACEVGWGGPECAVPTCPSACNGTGTCTAPGICTCLKGWAGVDCQDPVCEHDCRSHGECLNPGNCKCDMDWSGSDCSLHCVHGRMVTTKTNRLRCVCDKGWTSEACATPTCRGLGSNSGCGGNGVCISPDSCQCNKGFSGPDCSVIKGSNGKFFFTEEDSNRWQMDAFSAKQLELKAAEHDLEAAQRRAERRVKRERHVYHLANAFVVDEDKNEAGDLNDKQRGGNTTTFPCIQGKIQYINQDCSFVWS
mmetsp:Transcript_23647/g.58619  ORF Transcript_23647/g.58619 Transcript_23647/m.58619 type:complete len:363 (-) Transcript_23647:1053-2141(-)